MVGSPSNLSDFSGPSALEQRLDAFVFKALPSRSGSFNGDVDADSEDIEDLLRERKVEDVPVSGKVSRRHLFFLKICKFVWETWQFFFAFL